ncbi:MAG: NADH:flavin oxidoreductase/NADH oxidase [Geminicoccaceae bacterium]
MTTLLFEPITLRGITSRNRIMVSPMCTYAATDGVANDWHMVHLGQFALGGAGIVCTEAAAVSPEGRITHGDLGIWDDELGEALVPVAAFLRKHGAVPAIQLAHAGRKASRQRPWFGNGPLGEEDLARGDRPWPIVAPSDEAFQDGWLVPAELSEEEIAGLVQNFADAARRADRAGFDAAEIHGAHGYLLHSFLSPLSNHRTDSYGGSAEKRMRFPLEVARAVRAVWPENKPLFFRVSSVDGAPGGREIEDTVELAKALKAIGVDAIDCSSGGVVPKERINAHDTSHGPGLHVPFAEQVRKEAGIHSIAVGLILDGPQAEDILRQGRADIVALARGMLEDPFWPLHQAHAMGLDESFEAYPQAYGWWLLRRANGMRILPGAKS